MQVFEN